MAIFDTRIRFVLCATLGCEIGQAACRIVRVAVQRKVDDRLMGLDEKPSEKQLRDLAEAWRPYRGAAAVLAWHSYNSSVL